MIVKLWRLYEKHTNVFTKSNEYRDVIVCVKQVEWRLGLNKAIFVNESTYNQLITLCRSSLLLPIPDDLEEIDILGGQQIIAPSYEKTANGKKETLIIDYGTIFSVDFILCNISGDVSGLQEGFMLIEVSKVHQVTQRLVDSCFR